MPTCVLRYCQSRSSNTSERACSFYAFPLVDKEIREKWIQFVQSERRQKSWFPSAASKLCSKHFRNDDMSIRKSGRTYLKKGSVPCALGEEDETNPRSITPVSVDVSNAETISNTANEIALKAKVQKLKIQNIQHQATIKKLVQQNRSFKRRVINLKKFVRHLVIKYDLHDHNAANSHQATAKVQAINDRLNLRRQDCLVVNSSLHIENLHEVRDADIS